MRGAPSSWPDRGALVACLGFAIAVLDAGHGSLATRTAHVHGGFLHGCRGVRSGEQVDGGLDDFELVAELYDDRTQAHIKLDNYTGPQVSLVLFLTRSSLASSSSLTPAGKHSGLLHGRVPAAASVNNVVDQIFFNHNPIHIIDTRLMWKPSFR